MIVEDNIPFRTLFKGELLSRFSSMEVIEARHGEEAIKSTWFFTLSTLLSWTSDCRDKTDSSYQKIKADCPAHANHHCSSHDSPEYGKLQYDVEPVALLAKIPSNGRRFLH